MFYTPPPFGGSEQDKIRNWTLQLYKEFQDICCSYHVRSLRSPSFRIDEVESRWGEWNSTTRTIGISRKLVENYSWDAVIDVLKHEMAHMIVNEIFHVNSSDHSHIFRRACHMLAVSPWASASEEDMRAQYDNRDKQSEDSEEHRLYQKIKKLLALSTSSNEHEALLAIKRVKEIYDRHNLQELEANKPKKFVYAIINHKKKRISQHESAIASILTAHFFVQVVYSSLYDAALNEHHKTIEILGSEDNVRMAEYIYYFLYNNLPILWKNYMGTHKSNRNAKYSFYLGVLTGFKNKLKEIGEYTSPKERELYAETPTTMQAVVSCAKRQELIRRTQEELELYLAQRFPRLHKRSSSRSYRDQSSFNAGTQKGKELSIHRPVANATVQGTLLLR